MQCSSGRPCLSFRELVVMRAQSFQSQGRLRDTIAQKSFERCFCASSARWLRSDDAKGRKGASATARGPAPVRPRMALAHRAHVPSRGSCRPCDAQSSSHRTAPTCSVPEFLSNIGCGASGAECIVSAQRMSAARASTLSGPPVEGSNHASHCLACSVGRAVVHAPVERVRVRSPAAVSGRGRDERAHHAGKRRSW